ncbi:MAG: Rpn family recombination-promoting nuclease/putative transposase [Candidatus Sericytochromatia bacterium]
MVKDKKDLKKTKDLPYKQMFGNITFFRQLLENFVSEEFVKEIDFNKCEKIDKSFVSKKYDKTESDLIYKVKLKNTEKEVYIYVLMEFQSTVDKFMSVRILNYITNLYIDMINS